MAPQHLVSELEALSQAHLSTILRAIRSITEQGCPEGSSIGPMTDYHMSTGGKRLRALLPLAVASRLEHDPESMIFFGAACELLHNATLVHDDLQDGDTMRRGKPTIWARFGAERAINLGDAMLYLTLLLLEQLPLELSARHTISLRLIRETLRVIDGQEREFLLKDIDQPTLEDYIQMVEGKTSGLFALPIVGAAELCGAPLAVLDALQEASRHLGVVFQIQDDLLDIYGDKGREVRGSDIAEGKISMLIVHALAHAPAQDAQWLRALLRKGREQVSVEEIERAIGLLEQTDAPAAAFAEIDRRIKAALHAPALERWPGLSQLLEELAEVFLKPIEGVRQDLGITLS